MYRIITILLSSTIMLSAMSYEQFKKRVISNSKILQRSNISLKATNIEGDILMRSENPTVEMELSRFNPDVGDSQQGYRASYSQSIRRDSYYNSLLDSRLSKERLSLAYVVKNRAKLILDIEVLYTNLVYLNQLQQLLIKDLKISKRVSNIAKERYESGAESRVKYLQSKSEYISTKSRLISLKREIGIIYYEMMSLASIDRDIELEKKFIYSIGSKNDIGINQSPLGEILLAKEQLLANNISLHSQSINRYSLFTELEKEPDQSVVRVGIEIELPIFNQKSQERALATIHKQQAQIDREQLQLSQRIQKKSIVSSISQLSKEYQTLNLLAKEQGEILELLEEGYRISKGSLLELMIAKQKVLETKKRVLERQKEFNLKKIELNYLQGKYND